MKPYRINTIEKCQVFLDRCREQGWKCWQMQYRWSEPEGFHAWFWHVDEEDVEIVTYNEDVQRMIVEFK